MPKSEASLFSWLVGGFNPSEKYESELTIPNI
jgi:hypothetical protein